jgi:aromatic ring-opening dioxygenase catalytic subunit (LigB family)
MILVFFAPELYEMQDPASIAPARVSREQKQLVAVNLDQIWRLDHGTWLGLAQVFSAADLTVLQPSSDSNPPKEFHLWTGAAAGFVMRRKPVDLGQRPGRL